MRKALKISIVALVAVLLFSIVPVVNYTVDVSGIYRTDASGSLEGRTVEILLSGHSAEGLENYDERLVKRLLIYGTEGADTIVLGSSRAALISSEAAGEQSLLNLSITGAALRDVIGIYGVYTDCGNTAKRVIISLDPWFLNSKYSSLRFENVLTDGYNHYVTGYMGYDGKTGYRDTVNGIYLGSAADMTIFDYPIDMQKELFSIPYFQNCIFSLISGEKPELTATDEHWTVLGSQRPDGSYCYPEEYRNHSEAAIIDLATSAIEEKDDGTAHILGIETMSEYDENRILFEDFIRSLCEQGIDVDLVMTPFNPIIYDYMVEHDRYSAVLSAADWFRSLARNYNIDVIGDFDPDALGAGVMDFYDGYHYRAENVALLLQELEG